MENWRFALKSILAHKMRSILTMLGIIIGIASVVVIVALGEGMTKSLEKELSGDKNNVQIYFTNYDMTTESDGLLSVTSAEEVSTEEEPKLTQGILQGLLTVDGVESYYTALNTNAEVNAGRKKAKNVTIDGVSQNFFDIKEYKLLAGRQFTPNDYTKFARIIMLDQKLAKKLFTTEKAALNQTVSFKDHAYRVIGVYETPANSPSLFTMNPGGNAIMTNTQLAAEEGMNENALIYVHVKDVVRSGEIGQAAADYLTKATGLKQAHYEIYDFSKQLESFKQTMAGVTLFIGTVAGISLLVGGIGVMNIMLVSVTERTREIGLRKALGATRGNILMQFLIEAVVLTTLGGIIGIGIAYGITGLVNVLHLMGQGMDAVISIPVILGSLTFSAGVGIVFGVLPANKASKLDPIEALRYE